jgi:hypothetical protein
MSVPGGSSRRWLVAALVVMNGACASGKTRRPVTVDGFRIVIENANWQEMTVYTQTEAGMKIRLGSVGTGETRTFAVRSGAVGAGRFRLLGDPIGSQDVVATQWLVVNAGGTALWKIGAHEATSWAMVR